MKINGSHPSHHVDNLKRSKAKETGKSEGFQESLDKAKTSSDTVKSGGLQPTTTTYPDPTRRVGAIQKKPDSLGSSEDSLKSAQMVEARAKTQELLRTPEEASSRVAEIKKLIQEGGVEAYFRSVDSEKVAERLLNSGAFDDVI